MAVAESSSQSQMPQFPKVSSLDLEQVELYYDVVLDELTVLYYGRQRRHSLRAISDNTYTLVDPASDELVGVEFRNFIKRYVPHNPSLGSAITVATILSDETNWQSVSTSEPSSGLLDRLYEQWKRVATPDAHSCARFSGLCNH